MTSSSKPVAWECPCGRESPKRGATATPTQTVVALREPVCPFCARSYRDEYRVEAEGVDRARS